MSNHWQKMMGAIYLVRGNKTKSSSSHLHIFLMQNNQWVQNCEWWGSKVFLFFYFWWQYSKLWTTVTCHLLTHIKAVQDTLRTWKKFSMNREVSHSLPFPADRRRTTRATKCKKGNRRRKRRREKKRRREHSSHTSLCSPGKGTERKGKRGGELTQPTVRNNSFGPRRKWFWYKSCPIEKRSSRFDTLKEKQNIPVFLKLGLSFNKQLLQCQQSWKGKKTIYFQTVVNRWTASVYSFSIQSTCLGQMWNTRLQVLFQRWRSIQESGWWKDSSEEQQFYKKEKKKKENVSVVKILLSFYLSSKFSIY